MGDLFNTILIQPTVNVLLFFYHIFLTIHLPYAFGFAIISLTALVRLILHPFFHKQMHMSAKMAEMKPHMDRLTKLHGKDKKKLQEEQMKLYKEMGINPASGCLLAIIQMPIFISLYRVLTLFTTTKGAHIIQNINQFAYAPYLKVASLDPHFFGINLWIMPSQFNHYGYFYLLIPVITGALQYFQVSLSTPPPPPGLTETPKKNAKEDKDEKKNPNDMQTAMTTQMKYIFPIMIGYFSFTLPVGLSLYWNIFSLFSIIQYVMYNKKLKALQEDKKLK